MIRYTSGLSIGFGCAVSLNRSIDKESPKTATPDQQVPDGDVPVPVEDAFFEVPANAETQLPAPEKTEGQLINANLILFLETLPTQAAQKIRIWLDSGGIFGPYNKKTFDLKNGAGVINTVFYAMPLSAILSIVNNNQRIVYVQSDAPLKIKSIKLQL